MYLCVCNAIKEKEVRHAVHRGAATVGSVFKANGCKPQCAQCVNCIRNVIEEEIAPPEMAMAAE